MARALAFVVLLGALGCQGDRHRVKGPLDVAHATAVGAGYITTALPAGESPPADASGRPVVPKVTVDFAQLPTSNGWWSSLIWAHDPKNPYSESMFPHPLSVRAVARGLEVGHADRATITEREYAYRHEVDLVVGAAGLSAPDARVASYGDFTVTAAWGDRMKATFGHGLPFVYVETGTAGASVELAAGAESQGEREVMTARIRGRTYALFAPAGSRWSRSGNVVTSDLGGRGRYSVSLLPEDSEEALALLQKHAYAFVTSSRVAWTYDPSASVVETSFTVETSGQGEALLALYPHQWLHTTTPLSKYSYASPRGPMKLALAGSFVTRTPYHGTLPVLPAMDGLDQRELAGLLSDIGSGDDLFPKSPEGTRTSYWMGKCLGRLASATAIADTIGRRDLGDRFAGAMRAELEDWFDGRAPSFFVYDKTWRTLIAVPTAYQSGAQLNDHHFNYGYFVHAAAVLAARDPVWGRTYAPMVELLIRDAASPDRKDDRFPFLRHFDVYAGHSWANGPALFADGNNEESSSEDVNFANAVTLWGTVTGDAKLRDLGVLMKATLVVAIEQYWFDVDRRVFPRKFGRGTVAMVWGDGGRYDTWWTQDPVYIHGINYLPFTAGSLYLGHHPEYVRHNYAELVRNNRGEPMQWRDIAWMYLALAEPKRALSLFEQKPHFKPEYGHSMAFLYHWLHELDLLGQVDTTITANVPAHAVFHKGTTRTYVAFRGPLDPETVTFTDGTTMKVAPLTTTHVSRGGAP